MLNNVSLVGRITADPESRKAGDVAVVNFTLAVNRPIKNADGDREADFISCVAWDKQATFIIDYVKKGHQLALTGAINTRTYEHDGSTRYVTEVRVSSVTSLEPKPKDEESASKPEQKDKPKAKAKTKTASIPSADEQVAHIKDQWLKEYKYAGEGLDKAGKEALKIELTAKYQPQIDAILNQDDDLPF